MRLFLDANVLFTAAHNPVGKAALIIELGGKGKWEVVSSSYAVEEARRNIAAKFPAADKKLKELIDVITVIPSGLGRDCLLQLPDKDRPIMEAAMRIRASHLLTGDFKDFGPYMNKPKKTAGVLIQTVSQFLDSL